MKIVRIVVPVILLLAIIAAVIWYLTNRDGSADSAALTGSGTVETTEVTISPELAGRIVEVFVKEGDQVTSGDTLVQLDTTLLQAQRDQAEAALKVAQANAAAAAANLDVVRTSQPSADAALAAARASMDAALANQALLKAGPTDEQQQVAQAQLNQAEANRQALEANLYTLTSNYRPEEVRAAWERLNLARQIYYKMTVVLTTQQIEDVRTAMTTAQSNLTQAEARKTELEKDNRTSTSALGAASDAITDAQAILDATMKTYNAVENTEQPLYAQIESARMSWDLAQLNLSQAQARHTELDADPNMTEEALDAAQSTIDDARTQEKDTKAAYDALADSDQSDRLDEAWNEAQDALRDLNAMGRGGTTIVETLLNQLDVAAAQRDAAAATLTSITNGTRQEQLDAAQAQVDGAQAQVDSAQVQVEAANSRVDIAQDQSDAAQAQVEAAQAALDIIDVQIGKLTILSPLGGVVMSRAVQPGEITLPNATLLVLGLEDDKTITVYIPENRYGEVKLGDNAQVKVDSFPNQTFEATVTYIADQAEFTPRNVQTAEGRSTTVYAVKLAVQDPQGLLKPGMPADVTFSEP
jgi:HlyD family secretion protein